VIEALARGLVLTVLLAVPAISRAADPVLVPGETVPQSVAALGGLDGASALGISADGEVAAVVAYSERSDTRSSLRAVRFGSAPREIELPGLATAMVLAPDGGSALVVVRELGKKDEVRSVRLLRVDLSEWRVAASVNLPETAMGLALRNGDDAVLVASRDEIRTFLLPGLSSGPLYRVLGDNAGVAPLSGTTRALVIQGRHLVLVDFSAPQTRDGLAIVERMDLPAATRAIVSAPDTAEALVIDEDGSVVRAATDPLRIVPAGRAAVVAWPGAREAFPPPSSSPAAPEPPSLSAPPLPAPPPVPESSESALPVEPAPPAAPAPPVEPAAPVETPAGAPPSTEGPAPAAAVEAMAEGSVRGVVAGPARQAVEAVVALGPDNVLNEAGRVRPDDAGVYRFEHLRSGSYRVVAVGAAGRVLLCDPSFLVVKVGPGSGVAVPAINVLRAVP
jgi:hypothetical protein